MTPGYKICRQQGFLWKAVNEKFVRANRTSSSPGFCQSVFPDFCFIRWISITSLLPVNLVPELDSNCTTERKLGGISNSRFFLVTLFRSEQSTTLSPTPTNYIQDRKHTNVIALLILQNYFHVHYHSPCIKADYMSAHRAPAELLYGRLYPSWSSHVLQMH